MADRDDTPHEVGLDPPARWLFGIVFAAVLITAAVWGMLAVFT